MKKLLASITVIVLLFSMSLSAFAASDNSKGGNGEVQQKSGLQKEFKFELNEQKKTAAKNKNSLQAERDSLETKYQELLTSGDKAGAEALLANIKSLDAQIETLRVQIREMNNQRFMVAKTLYSNEELAQFDSAAALIKQMYADAEPLNLGSVIVKDNLIKFDAPPYIKGGRTLVPVRAITEGLGAEVSWDEATQSVTITKDGKVVVMNIGSGTVTVDGVPAVMDVPAEIACSRTYVPLRFLAEIYGLDVSWDGDTETIEIGEQVSPEVPAGNTVGT